MVVRRLRTIQKAAYLQGSRHLPLAAPDPQPLTALPQREGDVEDERHAGAIDEVHAAEVQINVDIFLRSCLGQQPGLKTPDQILVEPTRQPDDAGAGSPSSAGFRLEMTHRDL